MQRFILVMIEYRYDSCVSIWDNNDYRDDESDDDDDDDGDVNDGDGDVISDIQLITILVNKF